MTRAMLRTVILWALVLAAAAFALQWLEFQYLAIAFSREIYIGIIATLFAAGGLWLGWRLASRPRGPGFARNDAAIAALGLTRQELRDEHKQAEGDPMIKGRLKQIRNERARRRMMQEVPKADVVITNPTHFAVALRYDQAAMAAPKVVAKGADAVARRIRELADPPPGTYRLVFHPPSPVFRRVELEIELDEGHHHVPLLVSSYACATYRGS